MEKTIFNGDYTLSISIFTRVMDASSTNVILLQKCGKLRLIEEQQSFVVSTIAVIMKLPKLHEVSLISCCSSSYFVFQPAVSADLSNVI